MDIKREQLLPSADLSEFYKEKISISLRIIYVNWLDVNDNYSVLKIINSELHQIYKQIYNRLIKYQYNNLVDEYKKTDEELNKLKPFSREIVMDKESGERSAIVKKTADYINYYYLIEQKEMIIYDCLDSLGLFGTVQIQTRRLR